MSHSFVVGYLLILFIFSLGVKFRISPGDFNKGWGYYSKRSRQNEDTWLEANAYAGNCLMLTAVLLLIIFTIMNSLNRPWTEEIKIISLFFVFQIFLSVYMTERMLRRRFFRDGKRKPTN